MVPTMQHEESLSADGPVTAGEAPACPGDGRATLGAGPWVLLRPALPLLLRTIRSRLGVTPASAPPLAAWLLWVEALLMLTPAQAAERVGISVSLIYQLCAERRLPHFRIGGDGRRGKLLIDEADLETFLSACRVDADGLDESEPLKHIR